MIIFIGILDGVYQFWLILRKYNKITCYVKNRKPCAGQRLFYARAHWKSFKQGLSIWKISGRKAMDNDSNKIGVVPATLLVAGNMMGSGVFMLPANLAAIGSIAVLGWLVTIVGAIALALVFSKLTQIYTAAGGPYAYTRKAFGDYMGYQTNLVYWLANVIGNVALVVAGLGYLTPFAVSRARENALMWRDDAWKNPESMALYQKDLVKAVCNIKGTFNGVFQFTNTNIAKAVLYGLVQRRNPELQKFCRGFIRPGVDIEKHAGFQKFRKSYLQAVEKFDNGEGTRQDLMRARFGWILDQEFNKPNNGFFAIMDYSKANFHKLSMQNPEMSLLMQETFAVNVYMVMSVHSEKIFNHLDPMTLGPIFAAMIHVPNDAKTVDIIIHNTPEKAREELIRIHGEPTKADERMWKASKKVNNKGYYGSTFARNFAWITDNPQFWHGFMCGVKAMAEREMFKDCHVEGVLTAPWAEQVESSLLDAPKIVPPMCETARFNNNQLRKFQQREEQKKVMRAFWLQKQRGRK